MRQKTVTAEQWFPHVNVDGVVVSPVLEPTPDNPGGCYGQVETEDGTKTCIPGDWILTYQGHRYVWSNDLFQSTYELVDGIED
jgi:hypothetical protein